MSQRSYRLRQECVQQVKSSYKQRYARWQDLVKDLPNNAKVGEDTVRKFLNGKAISRENFWNLVHKNTAITKTLRRNEYHEGNGVNHSPVSNAESFRGSGKSRIKIKGKRINFAFVSSFYLFYVPDAYFMLALASFTAAKKKNPVSGMLNARIIAVAWKPKSGRP